MFERRLRLMLIAVGVALLVIVGRLGQMQLLQADYFRERTERSLLLRPVRLPFVRGRILDRTGQVLVSQEPCWEITLDYRTIAAVVSEDPAAIKREVKRWRRADRRRFSFPESQGDPQDDGLFERMFHREMDSTWQDVAGFVSESAAVDRLGERVLDLYDRVSGIRRAVAKRRGFDAPVVEETVAHAIVTGLDVDGQIAARQLLGRYPWVHVESASKRVPISDATPFAHLLGRVGRVDATHVANDPNADDPFARYLANEHLGISGVEAAAESVLRGRRGQIRRDRTGAVVDEGYIESKDGEDVTLTIHADLQRRLYRLLGDGVGRVGESSGGAIVVLDIRTREVLALVSYPSYDPTRFDELYSTLRDDTDRLPLRFRAVSNRYAPGSIIKPLICIAGLMNGKITLGAREKCTGYLFPERRDRWRCWQIHGTQQRKAHGYVDVVGALRGSCNVMMYRLGERIGIDGLCNAFDMMGIGRYTGIGLREEVRGINPTPGWLMQHKNARPTPGTARLFAIGQGEVAVTPVQAANLMATYASGCYRPVTLIRSDKATPEWTIPASADQWAAVRQGIYAVVNDSEGTAYRYAHWVNDGYALCGKTGSATAHPWPTAYEIDYLDESGAEQVAVVPAGAKGPAIEHFRAEHPSATFDPSDVTVASRWPTISPSSGKEHSHAWFAGYLQPLGADGQPDWSRPPRIAFAVLIEFGGSGGRTGGPLGKAIAAQLVEVLGPDLNAGVPRNSAVEQ